MSRQRPRDLTAGAGHGPAISSRRSHTASTTMTAPTMATMPGTAPMSAAFVERAERDLEKLKESLKERLQTDMLELLQDSLEADLILVVPGEEIPVHRCILKARARDLYSAIVGSSSSSKIRLDFVDTEDFREILQAIYTEDDFDEPVTADGSTIRDAINKVIAGCRAYQSQHSPPASILHEAPVSCSSPVLEGAVGGIPTSFGGIPTQNGAIPSCYGGFPNNDVGVPSGCRGFPTEDGGIPSRFGGLPSEDGYIPSIDEEIQDSDELYSDSVRATNFSRQNCDNLRISGPMTCNLTDSGFHSDNIADCAGESQSNSEVNVETTETSNQNQHNGDKNSLQSDNASQYSTNNGAFHSGSCNDHDANFSKGQTNGFARTDSHCNGHSYSNGHMMDSGNHGDRYANSSDGGPMGDSDHQGLGARSPWGRRRVDVGGGEGDDCGEEAEPQDNHSNSEMSACCSRLGEDLLRMFLSGQDTDTTLRVGDAKYHAHRCLLVARSEYFAAMLSGSWSESDAEEIQLDGLSPAIVSQLLRYIYGGATTITSFCDSSPPGATTSPLSSSGGCTLLEAAAVADMFCVDGLKEVVGAELRRDRCHYFHKPCAGCVCGVAETMPLSLTYGLAELYDTCLRWSTRHFHRVWADKRFAHMPAEIRDECVNSVIQALSVDTVLDTISSTDRLRGSLTAVHWSAPVVLMATRVMDAAISFLRDNMAAVISSDALTRLHTAASFSLSFWEDILGRVALSLPAASTLGVHAALDRMLTQADMEGCSWPEEFISLLRGLQKKVQQAMAINIQHLIHTPGFRQTVSPELQLKLIEESSFIWASDPRSSSGSSGATKRSTRPKSAGAGGRPRSATHSGAETTTPTTPGATRKNSTGKRPAVPLHRRNSTATATAGAGNSLTAGGGGRRAAPVGTLSDGATALRAHRPRSATYYSRDEKLRATSGASKEPDVRRSRGGSISSSVSTTTTPTTPASKRRSVEFSAAAAGRHRPNSAASSSSSKAGGSRELRKGSSKEIRRGSSNELGRGSSKELKKGSSKELGKGSSKELGKGSSKELGKGSSKELGKGSSKELALPVSPGLSMDVCVEEVFGAADETGETTTGTASAGSGGGDGTTSRNSSVTHVSDELLTLTISEDGVEISLDPSVSAGDRADHAEVPLMVRGSREPPQTPPRSPGSQASASSNTTDRLASSSVTRSPCPSPQRTRRRLPAAPTETAGAQRLHKAHTLDVPGPVARTRSQSPTKRLTRAITLDHQSPCRSPRRERKPLQSSLSSESTTSSSSGSRFQRATTLDTPGGSRRSDRRLQKSSTVDGAMANALKSPGHERKNAGKSATEEEEVKSRVSTRPKSRTGGEASSSSSARSASPVKRFQKSQSVDVSSLRSPRVEKKTVRMNVVEESKSPSVCPSPRVSSKLQTSSTVDETKPNGSKTPQLERKTLKKPNVFDRLQSIGSQSPRRSQKSDTANKSKLESQKNSEPHHKKLDVQEKKLPMKSPRPTRKIEKANTLDENRSEQRLPLSLLSPRPARKLEKSNTLDENKLDKKLENRLVSSLLSPRPARKFQKAHSLQEESEALQKTLMDGFRSGLSSTSATEGQSRGEIKDTTSSLPASQSSSTKATCNSSLASPLSNHSSSLASPAEEENEVKFDLDCGGQEVGDESGEERGTETFKENVVQQLQFTFNPPEGIEV